MFNKHLNLMIDKMNQQQLKLIQLSKRLESRGYRGNY